MRFSLRYLLLIVTLLAVIFAQSAFILRTHRELEESHLKRAEEQLRRASSEAELARQRFLAQELSKEKQQLQVRLDDAQAK